MSGQHLPAPTAPDVDTGVKTLETLIEEATNIATVNQGIIAEIRGVKQFWVFRYYVDAKPTENSWQFDVEEVREILDYEALSQIWHVPPEYKLTAITPDLFRDGINYDCNTIDDVSTVNEQMLECCKKYWFLDQSKASPFVLKFIKNFELLQASLLSVCESYVKPKSLLEEVRERVSSINSSIKSLSEITVVSFERKLSIGKQVTANKPREPEEKNMSFANKPREPEEEKNMSFVNKPREPEEEEDMGFSLFD